MGDRPNGLSWAVNRISQPKETKESASAQSPTLTSPNIKTLAAIKPICCAKPLLPMSDTPAYIPGVYRKGKPTPCHNHRKNELLKKPNQPQLKQAILRHGPSLWSFQ